jgi:hypothetical protein
VTRITLPNTINEEFDFWSSHDSTDSSMNTKETSEKLEVTKPKSGKQRITMLLGPRLKTQLQRIAEEKRIRYQTLIQM